MEKFYRMTGTVIEYGEVWRWENTVHTHFGVVGSMGQHKPQSFPTLVEAEQYCKEQVEWLLSRGFASQDELPRKNVVVRIPGKEDSWALLSLYQTLKDEMDNALGWSGNGECMGGEIGAGEAEIFCEVIDAEKAMRLLGTLLQDRNVLGNIFIESDSGRGDTSPEEEES